jgi:hypothetical protein
VKDIYLQIEERYVSLKDTVERVHDRIGLRTVPLFVIIGETSFC